MTDDHELVSIAFKDGNGSDYGHKTSSVERQTSSDRDVVILARLGKKQVLKASTEGVLVLFASGFLNGGPAGLVYGFLVISAGTLSTFLSIAELSSIAPTAGGQYHVWIISYPILDSAAENQDFNWVALLAPKSTRKFLSYMTGWLTITSWQPIIASGAYLTATIIQGLLVLNYPTYVFERWHRTLIFFACIVVSVFINTVVSSALPKIEGYFFIVHILGFFAILIVLSYMAPHGSAQSVFDLFINKGGWNSQGLSFMVGLSGLAFSFIGTLPLN
ncbi:hypothetical protein MMC25_004013 [Agyrium rufum]|nr:hypothetical protein [Agyrium rufum]